MIKSYAKINLSLNVLGKINSNLHRIETLVSFINLYDEIYINENIPQKAGLGGGSMNAATILRYFLSKINKVISKNKLYELSDKIGSDVKFGLELNNTILLGNQNILRTQKKIGLYCVLIKPNFGCSTKSIYKKIRTFSKPNITRNFIENINIKKLKF